jgi:quercetin 2,3-dioxygenase
LFASTDNNAAANDTVVVRSGNQGARFVLLAAKPLGEAVAWGGPIVMNTNEELELAFEELDAGTFIKHKVY